MSANPSLDDLSADLSLAPSLEPTDTKESFPFVSVGYDRDTLLETGNVAVRQA